MFFPRTAPELLPVFCVVVEGPNWCILLVGFSCNFWLGEPHTPSFQNVCRGKCSTQWYYMAHLIWAKDGSKHVIPRKDVPFGGVTPPTAKS